MMRYKKISFMIAVVSIVSGMIYAQEQNSFALKTQKILQYLDSLYPDLASDSALRAQLTAQIRIQLLKGYTVQDALAQAGQELQLRFRNEERDEEVVARRLESLRNLAIYRSERDILAGKAGFDLSRGITGSSSRQKPGSSHR
ncbi:MAG: hypothetical protein LDL24_06815 [Treponema sp.]|nr:hypothetical protein [Treponema sp.]